MARQIQVILKETLVSTARMQLKFHSIYRLLSRS